MKKRGIILITSIVCVLAAIAALFGYRMMQQKQQIRDLLELGNQYLEDEQYEEAIASYKQLLAIEPKEETARENIVVAAVEWSDDLIEVHEYEKAEEIIADVQSIVPDDRLEIKRQEITDKRDAYEKEQLKIKKKEEERTQALEQINDSLSELAKICSAGDDDAIFNYMEGATYRILNNSEYIEFDKKYETEYGTLGLYEGGSYLYYGDYEGEMRSGNGVWYRSSTGDFRYVSKGEWRNDVPNGKQTEEVRDSLIIEGDVIDGLWNGVTNITTMFGGDSAINQWVVNFQMGYAEVLASKEMGAVVAEVVKNGTERTLSFFNPNQLRGIGGFAQCYAGLEMRVSNVGLR